MSDTLRIESKEPPPERPRRFPLLSLIVMFALAGAFVFYFWSGKGVQTTTRSQFHLPFGPAEQSYAKNIHFEHIGLNRAENFLHQEVTSLAGELVNAGDRAVRNVEVTVTYSDEMHQVVLRESRVLFGRGAPLLPAGGQREFELSYEHIPSSWNRELPAISVTGLQF